MLLNYMCALCFVGATAAEEAAACVVTALRGHVENSGLQQAKCRHLQRQLGVHVTAIVWMSMMPAGSNVVATRLSQSDSWDTARALHARLHSWLIRLTRRLLQLPMLGGIAGRGWQACGGAADERQRAKRDSTSRTQRVAGICPQATVTIYCAGYITRTHIIESAQITPAILGALLALYTLPGNILKSACACSHFSASRGLRGQRTSRRRRPAWLPPRRAARAPPPVQGAAPVCCAPVVFSGLQNSKAASASAGTRARRRQRQRGVSGGAVARAPLPARRRAGARQRQP